MRNLYHIDENNIDGHDVESRYVIGFSSCTDESIIVEAKDLTSFSCLNAPHVTHVNHVKSDQNRPNFEKGGL